ncbi:MAG: hypothetical protein WBY44_34675 [Bryobacteraceae bacterium]
MASSEQGTPEFNVTVRVITPRVSVRVPVTPTFANGRLTELMTPLATVNGVAVPMTVPLALRNETVPVQEAAVPLDEFDAVFTILICAVSELASPTGGVFDVSVTVPLVVVCDSATAAVKAVAVRSL